MEEIDNIIIESLKHIKCNIQDELSIKEFDSDTVVDAIASCLETINPQLAFPHKLPPSMSSRLQLATTLAEAIRELGFRGDIGYQTILYCNEIELRRVLMFLIERLPRESDQVLPTQELGYAQKVKRRIEETVRISLTKLWCPTVFLKHGIRQCGNIYIQQSYKGMYPLRSENLIVPRTQENSFEELKQYWIHHLPDVTKQVSKHNLIPSLLFRDSDLITIKVLDEEVTDKKEETDVTDNAVVVEVENESKVTSIKAVKSNNAVVVVNEIQDIITDIEEQKEKVSKLKEYLKENKSKLSEVLECKTKEETLLKEYISQYKTKSKTLTILSNEENLKKLKHLVQNGNYRLTELSNQWKEVQTPLLEEYKALKANVDIKESKYQIQQNKLKETKSKIVQLMEELKRKEKLENQLREECERFSKNTGRSAYTKRILEIIANINKQNQEIQKILNDTKEVQKDINNLNGQLDRSFTLSDELIFRNAKQDDMSRKAYKLLATLHNDCNSIIQAVTELGLVERESRNLQEQIDSEASKSTASNLERVNADLMNIKREISSLSKQV